MKEKLQKILGQIWEFIKKVSIPDAIFVAVILILFILPNTKFDKKEYEFVEKRPLATMPKLIVDGKINKEFGKQFENFYNDRFRKRNVCIDRNLAIKGYINGRMENYLEIEGQDSWLFLKADNSIANFQNKVLFSDVELSKIKRNLDILNAWCRKNNIKLIVIIPPDKNRVYGEYYPKHIKKVNPKSRVELLREYMSENSNIEIIYPVEQMFERKKLDNEPLYYYSDTHWTQTGSYVAYKELLKRMKKHYSFIVPIDNADLKTTRMTFKERFNREGDGVDNLKMGGRYNDHDYLVFQDLKNGQNEKKYNLRVTFLGDSFSGELRGWFSRSFYVNSITYNETVELADNFSMALWEDKILSYNPDVLVVEFLERYAYKLLDLYKD